MLLADIGGFLVRSLTRPIKDQNRNQVPLFLDFLTYKMENLQSCLCTTLNSRIKTFNDFLKSKNFCGPNFDFWFENFSFEILFYFQIFFREFRIFRIFNFSLKILIFSDFSKISNFRFFFQKFRIFRFFDFSKFSKNFENVSDFSIFWNGFFMDFKNFWCSGKLKVSSFRKVPCVFMKYAPLGLIYAFFWKSMLKQRKSVFLTKKQILVTWYRFWSLKRKSTTLKNMEGNWKMGDLFFL